MRSHSVYKKQFTPPRKYTTIIHILYDNLTEENKNLLLSLSSQSLSINLINVTDFLYGHQFYSKEYLSIAMYYRFFIPLILKEYEKVLYLDCDVIINKPIHKLFDYDLKDNVLGVVKDVQWWSPNYFNSGVILFNIKEYLKQDICTKLLKYINTHQNLTYPDQDAFNAICLSKVSFLNRNYNFSPYCLFKDYLTLRFINKKIYSNVRIFHFYGPKPWQIKNYPFYKKWWKTTKNLPKELLDKILVTYKPYKIKLPKIHLWKIYSIFGKHICNFVYKIVKK